MSATHTRTKLRMGLISPKRSPEGGGVTSDELDILLSDEPEANEPSRRPSRVKLRRCKKTSPKKS